MVRPIANRMWLPALLPLLFLGIVGVGFYTIRQRAFHDEQKRLYTRYLYLNGWRDTLTLDYQIIAPSLDKIDALMQRSDLTAEKRAAEARRLRKQFIAELPQDMLAAPSYGGQGRNVFQSLGNLLFSYDNALQIMIATPLESAREKLAVRQEDRGALDRIWVRPPRALLLINGDADELRSRQTLLQAGRKGLEATFAATEEIPQGLDLAYARAHF